MIMLKDTVLQEETQSGLATLDGETQSIVDEVWKLIDGYPYSISNYGRVKSHDKKIQLMRGETPYILPITGRILSPIKQNNGYLTVSLSNGNGIKIKTIHRLVAIYFIPNPDNKPVINHLNGVRHDNRIENLEWCTQGDNIRHRNNVLGYKTPKGELSHMFGKRGALCSFSKPINQLSINREFIKRWDSMADINRELGCNQSLVHRCCNNIELNGYGFKWEYA